MDSDYQRRLMAAEFLRLEQRIKQENRKILVEHADGTTLAKMYGRGGDAEPYLAKIEAGFYPVQPWRVGFIDPTVESESRLTVPDRDPRFWPFSGLPGLNGGFHVAYSGPFRVFVCMPFSVEYFYYHSDQRWEPSVYDLARVVIQLSEEVGKAEHFSKWFPLVRQGA